MNKTFAWMPILRTGKFTDKNGLTVEIDNAGLGKIISNTDFSKEPQFVIEHPKEDSVGFGTISALKIAGNYLFALPKEVNEKFKAAVNSGKLPGRSVTLDKSNFALKNISFLPPEISPAVSGLGSYAFSKSNDQMDLNILLNDNEARFAYVQADKFEFQQFEVSSYPFRSIQTLFRNVKNFLIENFSLDDAEKILPEYSLNDIGNPPAIFENPENTPEDTAVTNTNANPSFSSINNGDKMSKIELSKFDLSKIDANLKAAIEGLMSENQTLTTSLDTKQVELQAAATKLSAVESAKLRSEVVQFCESDNIKLKIKPADKEKAIQFLMAQKEKGVIEFSAPDNPATKVQFDAFEFSKELIKNSVNFIMLEEMATNANASSNTGTAADYLLKAKQMADIVNVRK